MSTRTRVHVSTTPVTSVSWRSLTDAERRVVAFVAEGLLYREIGRRLCLSPRTVESHVASVFRKVGVRSRSDFARAYRAHHGSEATNVSAVSCPSCGRGGATSRDQSPR